MGLTPFPYLYIRMQLIQTASQGGDPIQSQRWIISEVWPNVTELARALQPNFAHMYDSIKALALGNFLELASLLA